MKRKLLALALSLSMVLVFTACGEKDETSTTANTTENQGNSEQTEQGTKKQDAEDADVKKPESTGSGEKLVIGISVRNIENPYYVQIYDAVKQFAEYKGADQFDIQFIACDASDDQQVSDVQAMVARGGENTIIYIDPNNAAVCSSVAKICEEAGAYWCSVWSYADGVYPWDFEYYAFHQTPGQVESEKELCLNMFSKFKTPNQGKILAIKGLEGNTASIDRFAGLNEALKEAPNVELLDAQNGDWNPQTAQTLTNTWLNKYGAENIDAIWCANDEMALAVVESLKAQGLNGKIQVTGFDGITDAVNAIVAGDMAGTVGANPWVEGGQGVAFLYACWNKDVDVTSLSKEQRCFYTEPQILTPENVNDFITNYIDNTPEIDFENSMDMISAPLVLE